MDTQGILLISHGQFEKEFLENIANDVAREFLLPVSIENSNINLDAFYDSARRQYDGNRLLKHTELASPSPFLIKIGLFRVDLFIPILTYIFGQATLNGNAGIASLYRLKNELYGMEKDNELLVGRFKKVIIHELGHTFGLLHCHTPTCVMRSSTYVEDLDQKSSHFCTKCRDEIERLKSGF
ncbi:MAG: archaemetzincin family Zn-dependent metalloprotease [Bacteroidales bacterium]|nr:archaemetzincin family Zn-dependent metalloprotease [Bacteroidales bacterium]